jgi:hypothetical protein
MEINNANEGGKILSSESGRTLVAIITAIALLTAGSVLVVSFTPAVNVLAQESSNVATPTVNSGSSANRSSSSSSAIQLSPQPVFEEQIKVVSQNIINQTSTNQSYNQIMFSGNGAITPSNATERASTTSNGIVIVASRTNTFGGKEILTTADGSENATIIFSGIVKYNDQDGSGEGISTALLHTNSTGKLQPLDGMIMLSQEEIQPDGSATIMYWKWHESVT